MRLMSLSILAGAAAVLAACSPQPADSPGMPAPPAGQDGDMVWRCDADDARSLVGSHHGAVTFPREANVRMACTTCAVTQDYQENRLNLFFDEETGIIERVSCG